MWQLRRAPATTRLQCRVTTSWYHCYKRSHMSSHTPYRLTMTTFLHTTIIEVFILYRFVNLHYSKAQQVHVPKLSIHNPSNVELEHDLKWIKVLIMLGALLTLNFTILLGSYTSLESKVSFIAINIVISQCTYWMNVVSSLLSCLMSFHNRSTLFITC